MKSTAIPKGKTWIAVEPCDLPALGLASGTVYDRYGEEMPVLRAFANVNASTASAALVAAVPGCAIMPLSLLFVAGGTATPLTFNSLLAGGSDVPVSPLLANAANGGALGNHNPHGWFETATGAALTVTTGAGSATGILINYVAKATNQLLLNDGGVLMLNSGALLGTNS